ncbi:MAG: rhodanese-like domain-containing protein [Myxococcota bacterium]
MKPRTPAEILDEARRLVSTCFPAEVPARLSANPETLLIDVREPPEREAQAIPGAHPIPRGLLEFQVQELCPDAERPILVHCASGGRALCAARTLREMGYSRVTAIDGPIADLAAALARPAEPRSQEGDTR